MGKALRPLSESAESVRVEVGRIARLFAMSRVHEAATLRTQNSVAAVWIWIGGDHSAAWDSSGPALLTTTGPLTGALHEGRMAKSESKVKKIHRVHLRPMVEVLSACREQAERTQLLRVATLRSASGKLAFPVPPAGSV